MSTCEGPAPARTGPAESAPQRLAPERNAPHRQPESQQADRVAWERAASKEVSSTAARLIIGQLSGRADRKGQVRATAGDLSACCALPITRVSDVLADLASRGLLARDGRALVLVIPPRAGDPG